MPKKSNRRLRPKQTMRNKRLFRKVGNTNSLYRPRVPRTLQIATRRNNNQRLRFVVNHIYNFSPGTLAGTETSGMCYRANSIYNIRQGIYGNVANFLAQNASYSTATPLINADGWDEWTDRYQHFCVLGSKCQATFEPYGDNAINAQPGMLSIVMSGSLNAVNAGKDSSIINQQPYLKKVNIMPATAQNTGGRVYQFYSARKFEGVHDVIDNSQLRGRFAGTADADTPGEESFYYISLSKMNPGVTQEQMPRGILTIKIEYIVHLSEPTQTNDVQVPVQHVPIPYLG